MNNMYMCPFMPYNNMHMQNNLHYMDLYGTGNIAGHEELINTELKYLDEDEKDEKYFEEMHTDVCKKIMPYVDIVIDKYDEDELIYEDYPDMSMIHNMRDEVYEKVTNELPEAKRDSEDTRQFAPGPYLRGLAGALLIGEVLRRRRLRRRLYPYGYGPGPVPGYGYPYFRTDDEELETFDYEDYYFSMD